MFPLQEAEAGICYANAGISRAEGASASAQLQIPEVNPKDGKATSSEPELEAQPLGLPALDATSSESDCELEPQNRLRWWSLSSAVRALAVPPTAGCCLYKTCQTSCRT